LVEKKKKKFRDHKGSLLLQAAAKLQSIYQACNDLKPLLIYSSFSSHTNFKLEKYGSKIHKDQDSDQLQVGESEAG
jgi:hypothetical protein